MQYYKNFEHLHLFELFSERFTGELVHLRRRLFTLDVINVDILSLSIQMVRARQRHQSITQIITFRGCSQNLGSSSTHYEISFGNCLKQTNEKSELSTFMVSA